MKPATNRAQPFMWLSAVRLRSTMLRRDVGNSIAAVFQGSERPRHGLDGQAEIIGNVLARHRKLDGVTGRHALRHFQEEAHDALLRSLDEQQDALLHTLRLVPSKRKKLPGNSGSWAASAVSMLRLITSTFASAIASADKVCSSANSSPKMSPGR